MGYWKTSKMRLVSLTRNEGHDNLGSSTCFRCFQFLTSSWFEKQPFSGAKLAACMFAGIINGINFFFMRVFNRFILHFRLRFHSLRVPTPTPSEKNGRVRRPSIFFKSLLQERLVNPPFHPPPLSDVSPRYHPLSFICS